MRSWSAGWRRPEKVRSYRLDRPHKLPRAMAYADATSIGHSDRVLGSFLMGPGIIWYLGPPAVAFACLKAASRNSEDHSSSAKAGFGLNLLISLVPLLILVMDGPPNGKLQVDLTVILATSPCICGPNHHVLHSAVRRRLDTLSRTDPKSLHSPECGIYFLQQYGVCLDSQLKTKFSPRYTRRTSAFAASARGVPSNRIRPSLMM